jgi:hypothetical protein
MQSVTLLKVSLIMLPLRRVLHSATRMEVFRKAKDLHSSKTKQRGNS